MKTLFKTLVMALVLLAGSQARAGIPVIDAANLANSVQQVIAWGQQYTQMVQQIDQLQQQVTQAQQAYGNLNGIRGMASLVNNPSLRTYLPPDWNQTMNLLSAPGSYSGLSGSISAIKSASQIVAITDTGIDPNSPAGKAFTASQTQAAMGRALGEEGYKQASDRITSIQTLLDKVNDAPDAKDIADLQARIAAEQAMVANEHVKLALMGQLMQAQRDLQSQQAREISMKASKSGTVPRF